MTFKRHHLCGLALTLSIAATAAPAAWARPIDDRPDTSGPEIRVVRVDPGFDWRDAQIGAGAALVAAMIGVGGTTMLRSRQAS